MKPLTLSSYRWRCKCCDAYGEVNGQTIAGLLEAIQAAHREAAPECKVDALEAWPVVVQEEIGLGQP